MLKLSNLFLVILLFIGCVNSKKEADMIVFESHIMQYIDIYIRDNKKLKSESNVIIIQCETFSKNECFLNILSEMPENVHYSFVEAKDSIYFGYYKKFRVFIIDNNHKLLKGNYNSFVSLKDSFSDEIIPISYNGAFWNLKIRDGKIVDFSYQYCTPDAKVIEQLKSIPIPPSWGEVLKN